MKFFNIDCHSSVIADIKNIFENLGHSVENLSLSSYKRLFNFEPLNCDIINERNWIEIDEAKVDLFYNKYKKTLDKYDAFIVAYPTCFLKLYEKFNKPIIVVCATRYDYPFTDIPEKLEWLNYSINNNKNLILTCNNEFDKSYCEKFTKKTWEHIPSLCSYTKAKYSNQKNKTIIFNKFDFNLDDDLIHHTNLTPYLWSDLYSYRNIMHLPYNVSTMSIFEQYEAGVPLIFPSLKFALELIEKGYFLFSEIVFDNNNPENQKKIYLNESWIKQSDFYNKTIKVHYFDSFEECRKLRNEKLPNINISNKDLIYNKWSKILKCLDK